MNDKVRMEIKEDKVKQEIMKDFKSMRYAKQDRIKGYTTGRWSLLGKAHREAVHLVEWRENQALAEYQNAAERSPVKADKWAKKFDKIQSLREGR